MAWLCIGSRGEKIVPLMPEGFPIPRKDPDNMCLMGWGEDSMNVDANMTLTVTRI